jgi:DNA-directed RNA polymerase subunit M
MDFCPQCGSRLIPKTVETNTQTALILVCKKCGYKNRDVKDNKLEVKTIEHTPKQMVAVIDKKEEISTEPTLQIECPNCGNNVAYVWQVQTRGADESSTQFMRCTRCNHTFRETT